MTRHPKVVVPGRIGIGITTKNRHQMLESVLMQHRTYAPRDAYYVVVDDGSDIPVIEAISSQVTSTHFRGAEIFFISRRVSKGIARSKNDCIEHLLDKRQCEHIFLWDDDAWPIADNWWKPYIESSQPHLQASFSWASGSSTSGTPLLEIYRSEDLVSHHSSRGYMLYYHCSVLQSVGGMDERFRFGYEHIDHSNRIFRSGLTLFAHQDVPGSDKLIYSADSEESPIASSINPEDRRIAWQDNIFYLEDKERDSFFSYQYPHDCILTSYFTGVLDTQRNTQWEPDPVELVPLTASLERQGVKGWRVFHNELEESSRHYVKTACNLSPYIQRWICYREFLLKNPHIRWVWCVDATDVEALRNPFQDMESGHVYCGWENSLLDNDWMRRHTSDPYWIEANKHRTLLNAGVLGGDRETVLKVCAGIIELYTDAVKGCRADELGDMLYFNKTIYESGLPIVTGPSVTTVYKAFTREGPARFRHK